jgi:hypothetical protein
VNYKERRHAFIQEYVNFKVDLPAGQHGLYEIKRCQMDERSAMFHNALGLVTKTDRFSRPGVYTQLIRWGNNADPYAETVVMSDHLCEVADHEPLVTYAREHAPLERVLINGLGIGVCFELLAPYVQHFTVVELSASVIRLVAPHYQARYPGRIEIIQANALTYRPPKGVRYNAVFHDIWDFISHNNLAEMRHLQRRYGRLCDWQDSWARRYCERDARKRRRHPEQYEKAVDQKELYRALNTLFAITD